MPHISKKQIEQTIDVISVMSSSYALQVTDMLQSLLDQPEGEPVAWLITTELQDGTKRTYAATGKYKNVKDSCDFGDPVPLYTHPPAPRQPITADMVTDEMRYAFKDINMDSTFDDLDKYIVVAVNAYLTLEKL